MIVLIRNIFGRRPRRRKADGSRQPTVLITGASSGIGRVTAIHLAERGFHVIATSRSLDRLEPLHNEMVERRLALTPVELDINKNEGVNRVMPGVIAEHGPIDVLVNNAGYGLWGPLQTLSISEMKTMFETNFFGVVRMIHSVLPGMIERRDGVIVNVSSVLGRMGTPFNGAYVSSKFALEGMSESLRTEVKPFGVKVALVEPGLFNTNFQRNMVTADGVDGQETVYTPLIKRYRKNHDRFQSFGKDPINVARVIHSIIESRNPPFRNPVGVDARAGMLGIRLLPEKLYWPLLDKATMR
ncbi:MAG: SDR family oxidoreductase [Chloroflexi bacterium]|nr:SDR family oxidoreductase [Chloroflexota bacterium]